MEDAWDEEAIIDEAREEDAMEVDKEEPPAAAPADVPLAARIPPYT